MTNGFTRAFMALSLLAGLSPSQGNAGILDELNILDSDCNFPSHALVQTSYDQFAPQEQAQIVHWGEAAEKKFELWLFDRPLTSAIDDPEYHKMMNVKVQFSRQRGASSGQAPHMMTRFGFENCGARPSENLTHTTDISFQTLLPPTVSIPQQQSTIDFTYRLRVPLLDYNGYSRILIRGQDATVTNSCYPGDAPRQLASDIPGEMDQSYRCLYLVPEGSNPRRFPRPR